jgi:hypothetical protein
MRAHECHHCKQWIEEGAAHDCWTTTEAALTDDLSDDLKEAWERLREEAAALGEQRIYASGTAIMFARTACYCFVRPKRSFLQLVIFLGRTIRAPQVRRVERTSKAKLALRPDPPSRRSGVAGDGVAARSVRAVGGADVGREASGASPCPRGCAASGEELADTRPNDPSGDRKLSYVTHRVLCAVHEATDDCRRELSSSHAAKAAECCHIDRAKLRNGCVNACG